MATGNANKRAALYLRTSTDGQTTENQRLELVQIAERSGWEIIEVYEDHGISGGKGRDQRPAFKRLCEDAARRQFDVVMSWSVDRLGRSLPELVSFLDELHALRIDLLLHQQGVDTTTPSGKALYGMMGVFAEFERSMIRDRVKAGLARAIDEGKVLGRPRTNPRTEAGIRDALLRKDKGIRKIAREFSVGTSVVQRVKSSLPV